jgi:hypothetical protein
LRVGEDPTEALDDLGRRFGSGVDERLNVGDGLVAEQGAAFFAVHASSIGHARSKLNWT